MGNAFKHVDDSAPFENSMMHKADHANSTTILSTAVDIVGE
jgi:hypothetical protein